MPRVVVLMPVYNGGHYLHKAIKSILKQTFTDFELLIMDDASTDDSHQLIEKFKDPRITYQRNSKNLGLARTLNRGLELANCEYLVRMDADDISLPHRLEWQVAFMDNHRELGISGTWLRMFGSLITLGVAKYLETHDSMRACLLFCTPLAHPSAIIRHAEWTSEKLFYDPDFSRTEDYELWSRSMEKIRFGNLPKVTYLYRRHSASVTFANQGQMMEQYGRIVKRQLEQIAVIPTNEELKFHINIGLRGKIHSLTELRTAEKWLNYIRNQTVTAGYDKGSVQEAISLVWYRFARDAARFGLEGQKACLSSDLLIPESVSVKERAVFKAAVIYHVCRGYVP